MCSFVGRFYILPDHPVIIKKYNCILFGAVFLSSIILKEAQLLIWLAFCIYWQEPNRLRLRGLQWLVDVWEDVITLHNTLLAIIYVV